MHTGHENVHDRVRDRATLRRVNLQPSVQEQSYPEELGKVDRQTDSLPSPNSGFLVDDDDRRVAFENQSACQSCRTARNGDRNCGGGTN